MILRSLERAQRIGLYFFPGILSATTDSALVPPGFSSGNQCVSSSLWRPEPAVQGIACGYRWYFLEDARDLGSRARPSAIPTAPRAGLLAILRSPDKEKP